ncbi:MAG: universal stress protein [Sedimentisphaerales bacterium]|nr:universal stress protein [Sedimentisphaerales bacterium]NLZ06243.1 universal stress protein [Phycisphaerae bacterium]HNY79715.1 universal stress protein [Sedimentisphaerales bacterium]HOC64778.1 universal stress protein [Sedimentisphaerales bacterium]HOH65704.1 universal stress protein [Sedimentisphaerales bacterium]
MSTPRKILVYVDGTEQSITAAQYAICMASYFKADLIALYVINTKAMEDLLKARIFLQDEQIEYEHDMEADAQRYLNYVNELAIKKGVSLIQRSSRGSVHKEIVNLVDEQNVDLLVIGELARIRSRRDELYDETERAMRMVSCSVLIAKDEDKVWQMYESLV